MVETRQVRRQNERLARKSGNHTATRAEFAEARRHLRPNPAPIGLPPELPTETPGKGKFDGNCNRTACQAPIAGANWFNTSTRAYYCTGCAGLINEGSRRFDGVDIVCHVVDPADQPPFPWKRIEEIRARREARSSALPCHAGEVGRG